MQLESQQKLKCVGNLIIRITVGQQSESIFLHASIDENPAGEWGRFSSPAQIDTFFFVRLNLAPVSIVTRFLLDVFMLRECDMPTLLHMSGFSMWRAVDLPLQCHGCVMSLPWQRHGIQVAGP